MSMGDNTMQVDDKLISYLEDLSCLALSDNEKIRLTGSLQPILDSMVRLNELNTGDVPECSHPIDNVNVFRDDETHPSFDRGLILKNASCRNDEFFIAPKTVD
jgi:aspartyl/glutamyl-tRNA(Asn/Gln) amidotransferase C subunit